MEQLKLQVARARRRMLLQSFLGAAVWSCFAALAVAAIAITVQKIWLVGIDGNRWAWYWLGGATAASILATAIWTLARRSCELDAAIELDRRFSLKERVSSCFALTHDELNSPSGQALLSDAQFCIERLDVAGRFPVRLSGRAWLPLAPAAIAVAICLLPDPMSSSQASANLPTPVQQFQNASVSLGHKLAEQRQQAEKQGLKEAAELLKKSELAAQSLAKSEPRTSTEGLAKLNDLASQLDERRQQLAAGDSFKQHLAQIKSGPSGPADKLAQDLKNARFDSTLDDLESLSEQLAAGQVGPKAQQALAQQLQAMRDSLQRTIEAHRRALAELQRRSEAASAGGNRQSAAQIQDQIRQLKRQQSQIDRLAELAQSLDGAGLSMDGDKSGEGRAAGLAAMAEQFDRLQQEAATAQVLDSALEQIAAAKAATSCDHCGGSGCAACQDESGADGVGSSPGGLGQRPDEPAGISFFDANVEANLDSDLRKDGTTVAGVADTPNAKGPVLETIKQQIEAATRESTDPVTGQRLPRAQREHLRQYFDAIRDAR